MEEKDYYVLDSRAKALSLENPGMSMDEIDEDCERYVMTVDTAEECCDIVNEGDYGDDCIVVDEDWNVMWEWYNPDTEIWSNF